MKRCSKCQSFVYDGDQTICEKCGGVLEVVEEVVEDGKTKYPMKWYWFLMVLLPISAILNIKNAIMIFNGEVFMKFLPLQLYANDGMKTRIVATIHTTSDFSNYFGLGTYTNTIGILAIVTAVLSIVAMVRLAMKKIDGVIELFILRILVIVTNIIDYFWISSLLRGVVKFNFNIIAVVAMVAFLLGEMSYFDKRQDYFHR